MPIIGLTGRKGSGKSTVAQWLCENRGYQRVSFADPLKDMLRALGLTERQLYGDQKEEPSDLLGGLTPRHAMQTLGTEWGRDLIGPSIWIDAWRAKVSGIFQKSPYARIVVDDVRFPNEAGVLGGVCVYKIIRQDFSGLHGVHEEHLSEKELDNTLIFRHIYSKGSLDEFKKSVSMLPWSHWEQYRET